MNKKPLNKKQPRLTALASTSNPPLRAFIWNLLLRATISITRYLIFPLKRVGFRTPAGGLAYSGHIERSASCASHTAPKAHRRGLRLTNDSLSSDLIALESRSFTCYDCGEPVIIRVSRLKSRPFGRRSKSLRASRLRAAFHGRCTRRPRRYVGTPSCMLERRRRAPPSVPGQYERLRLRCLH